MIIQRQPKLAETAAMLYLCIPVIIFFAGFVRWEIAIATIAYLFFCLFSYGRNTSLTINRKTVLQLIYFALIGIFILTLSGAGGYFFRNIDWVKHYAVLNHLITHDWPTRIIGIQNQNDTLRYTIGWYLPSALLIKIIGWQIQDIALTLWSLTGLVIFFFLIANFIPGKLGSLLAPVFFLLFSGMDLVGGVITQWLYPPSVDLAWWNGEHLEWWSGWMSYSSIISLLFWTPQHAIATWVATALIMQQFQKRSHLEYIILVISSVMLTSSFAVIGLIPLLAALSIRNNIKKLFFNWQSILAVLLIALPLTNYLTASAASIPHGLAWDKACDPTFNGCFSIKSYLLIMMMEVLPFVFIIYFVEKKWRIFTAACGLFLLILPFVHMGHFNDLVMRASIPALAFLAILSTKVILDRKPVISMFMLGIFVLGSFTAAGEMVRAITWPNHMSPQTTFDNMIELPELYPQYFSSEKIWILESQ